MEYCTICMEKVVDKKNDLCKNCNKKRGAAKIVLELTNKVDFKDKFSKIILNKIGIKDKFRVNHYIWSLEECNLIYKEKNYYLWEDEEDIIKFVQKYSENLNDNIQNKIEIRKSNAKKCERCGKEIKIPNKKSKYCEKCKKINKTLKNISKIEKLVQFETPFTIDQLVEETNQEYWKLEGIVWDLQENDLILTNDSEEYILSKEKIISFKEKHQLDEPETNTKISKSLEKTSENDNISNIEIEEKTNEEVTKDVQEEIVTQIPKSRVAKHKLDSKLIEDSQNPKVEVQNELNNTKTNTITKKPKKDVEEKIDEKPISRLSRHLTRSNPIQKSIEKENEKNNITDERLNEIIEQYHDKHNKKFESINKTVQNINDYDNNDSENDKKQPNESKITKDNLSSIKVDAHKLSIKSKIIDIQNEIDNYLKNYVKVHKGVVEDSDVTSTDIFNSFNLFINDKYDKVLSNENDFIKVFTPRLFKIYPKAYRKFFKEGEYEIIRYNITLEYPIKEKLQEQNTSNEIKYETINKPILNDHEKELINIVKLYIEEKLEILERQPLNTDLTQREILHDFESYIQETDYIIETKEFIKIFKFLMDEYKIQNIFNRGRIRYNVEFKKAIKRPIDLISDEEKTEHIQKTLLNNTPLINDNLKTSTITPAERSIPKEIPVKIFAASYDEKSLIFIKTRINGNKFNLLLKLLKNTSDKISNINIKREDDDGLNISVEYTVPNNEKEEFIEIIQKYSWD